MTKMANFRELLAFGDEAEDLVGAWLRRKGFTILEVHRMLRPDEMPRGPRLLSPTAKIQVPDFLAWRSGVEVWVEVKRKNQFSFYRKTSQWTTGVDTAYLNSYRRIKALTGREVYLLFVQEATQPEMPSGVYIQEIDKLAGMEVGSVGAMTHWPITALKFIAPLEELRGKEWDSVLDSVAA